MKIEIHGPYSTHLPLAPFVDQEWNQLKLIEMKSLSGPTDIGNVSKEVCSVREYVANLLADKGNPCGRNFQTKLADLICQTCYMGLFLISLIPAVSFDFQNLGFIPACPMTFISILGLFRFI